jgi:glycosyltransferase involved in cell wall biosynthesis
MYCSILETPLITIGLTCYNAADTILLALRGALAQDWPATEIIVVDDCSSDDSAAIVGKALADVPRARLIRHAINRGTAAARNTILADAKGEFVAFFDDDDESLPERVSLQYETLREYEKTSGTGLIACYASGLRRYPNGYELRMPAIGSRAEVPKGEAVADYLLFNARRDGVFYGSGTPTCALMARLSTFRAVGGFDDSLRRAEDIDFAVRLALAGGHFIGCPQQLFLQHATVASDKTPGKNLEAELHLIEKHAGYLKRRHRYGYARDWFRIRYYHFSGQRLKFLAALVAFLLHNPVSGMRHLLRSFPARWVHERDMRARAGGMR